MLPDVILQEFDGVGVGAEFLDGEPAVEAALDLVGHGFVVAPEHEGVHGPLLVAVDRTRLETLEGVWSRLCFVTELELIREGVFRLEAPRDAHVLSVLPRFLALEDLLQWFQQGIFDGLLEVNQVERLRVIIMEDDAEVGLGRVHLLQRLLDRFSGGVDVEHQEAVGLADA